MVPSDIRVAECLIGSFKDHTSLLHICSANGSSCPPIFAYKGVWFAADVLDGAPPGSKVTFQQNGYFEKAHMVHIIEHIREHMPHSAQPDTDSVQCYIEIVVNSEGHVITDTRSSHYPPSLLILDAAKQHLDKEGLAYALSINMHVVSLPAHLTHILQVDDVSIFSPLKHYIRQACNRWHIENPGREMTRYDLCRILNEPWHKAIRPENVISGYRSTGTRPLNPSIVLDKIQHRSINKKKHSPSKHPTDSILSDESRSVLIMQRAEAIEREHQLMKKFLIDNNLSDQYKQQQQFYLDLLAEVDKPLPTQQPKKQRIIAKNVDPSLVLTQRQIIDLYNKEQAEKSSKRTQGNRKKKQNNDSHNKENIHPNTIRTNSDNKDDTTRNQHNTLSQHESSNDIAVSSSTPAKKRRRMSSSAIDGSNISTMSLNHASTSMLSLSSSSVSTISTVSTSASTTASNIGGAFSSSSSSSILNQFIVTI